jgi:hypothetical protein
MADDKKPGNHGIGAYDLDLVTDDVQPGAAPGAPPAMAPLGGPPPAARRPAPAGPPQAAPPDPPSFRVEAATPLEQVRTHLDRAFMLDPPDDHLLPDEARAFQVADPPMASARFRRFLTIRRSSLAVGGLLLALSVVFNLLAAFLLSKVSGGLPLVASLLTCLAGGGLVYATVRAYLGWDTPRQHRGLLGLAYGVYVALTLVQVLPTWKIGVSGLVGVVLALTPMLIGLGLGALRAGVQGKLLFPHGTLSGWLLSAAYPVFVVLAFAALIVPHQVAGGVVYLLSLVLLVAAPLMLWRAALVFRSPMTREQVLGNLAQPRMILLIAGGIAGIDLLVGTLAYFDGSGSVMGTFGAFFAFGAHVFLFSALLLDLQVDAMRYQLSVFTSPDNVSANRELDEDVEAFGTDDDNEVLRLEKIFGPGGR